MLTCLHARMPTCLHDYMLTCLHAYMVTCLDAYRYHWPAWALLRSKVASASMHPCIHASMHPCIHASMHPCIHAHNRVCIVIGIQRPGLLYVMGGGWEMCNTSASYNSYRDPQQWPYLTLPYLTLPYLKLVHSISILLFITLDYPILDCQSNP